LHETPSHETPTPEGAARPREKAKPRAPLLWLLASAAAALLALLLQQVSGEENPLGPEKLSSSPLPAAHKDAAPKDAARSTQPDPRASMSLSVSWRRGAHWSQREDFSAEELLAGFHGETVLGLDSGRLLREARLLLASSGAWDLLIEPSSRNQHAELVVAAASWLLARVERRQLSLTALEPVAEAVLASSGTLRARLVERMRSEEQLFVARLRRASGREDPRRTFARASAALGLMEALRPLARLEPVERIEMVHAARATGDARCMEFLLGLLRECLQREPEMDVSAWFEGLEAPQRSWLIARLHEEARASPRYDERTRLRMLRTELLTE
jgi:hypothetical protein